MFVYIGLVVIVCLLTEILQRAEQVLIVPGIRKKHRIRGQQIAFLWAFVILALFSIIRDSIGIDYIAYIRHIQLIQSGVPHYMEYGFKLLVLLLAKFSTNPRWVLIVLAFFTVLFFLIAMSKLAINLSFSIFIFMTWGYYFFTFNTVRNYFALSLALLSIIFLVDKKFGRFAICIAIAALFHKSALICIPLYLAAQKDLKKEHVFLVFLLIVIALLLKSQFRRLFFMFYPNYEGSAYDTNEASWLNIFKSIIVIGMGMVFYKCIKDDPISIICFNLNVFAFIFYIGFYWTPEISRIGFYMNTTSIILIPRLLSNVNIDYENKEIISIAIITGSCILFLLLMHGWYSSTIQLLPYKTWIGGTF